MRRHLTWRVLDRELRLKPLAMLAFVLVTVFLLGFWAGWFATRPDHVDLVWWPGEGAVRP